MKIQWNWGTGLVVAMGAFMIMVLSFVSVMVRQDVSLVEADYYPKGQAYQEMINKRANAAPYRQDFRVDVFDGMVYVAFPAFFRPKAVQGEVHLYHRVSDTADRYFTLTLNDQNEFSFDAGKQKGRYILKIDWKQEGVEYYTEVPVTIEGAD
jgi:hypothetical protein